MISPSARDKGFVCTACCWGARPSRHWDQLLSKMGELALRSLCGYRRQVQMGKSRCSENKEKGEEETPGPSGVTDWPSDLHD